MDNPEHDPLPLNYRLEEVSRIYSHIAAGNSCQVIGIGSVGKSNLLRFLSREDLRRGQLGPEWKRTLFIYVDSNKLIQQSEWGAEWSVWELMLHQMLVELTGANVPIKMLEQIDNLYRQAVDGTTHHVALRYLDRAVSLACKGEGLKIVFLFDEFDNLYGAFPSQVFDALRALRDDHKYQLMYVVAARKELSRLRKTETSSEAFEEIIIENTIWLTAYSESDALDMLHRIIRRHKKTLNQQQTHELLKLTGGHPGLIRAIFSTMKQQPSPELDIAAGSLSVQDECMRIWLSVTREEQKILTALANDAKQSVPSHILDQLRCKGLVDGNWVEAGQIFSSIFASFILKEKPTIGARIRVDRQKRIVWVDERKIANLSRLEFDLLSFLEKHRGQACTRDEIGREIYPEEVSKDGFGDNRIDSIVKRLRQEIEANPKTPEFIKNVHGVGFRLIDGETAKGLDEDN